MYEKIKKTLKEVKNNRVFYIMILPALVLTFIFPMCQYMGLFWRLKNLILD